MALGHLRIDPWEWVRWTLKEFDTAYEGWVKVNVHDRWEQARAISFYSLAPHTKVGTWKDVFKLGWDKKTKRSISKVSKMTDEERKEFEYIVQNSTPLNGK